MSGVNLNFNNSNAITGFDNPGQISNTSRFAIGDQPDSSGKAGWGHDSLPGLNKFPASAQEQILSASKELATAYEDVMARIAQSTSDGAPSHVLDNLKRVASDILGAATELLKDVQFGSRTDAVLTGATQLMDSIRSNMGELSKISKDPGIYYPDLTETAKPETSEEVSADIKSPDIASPDEFSMELAMEVATSGVRDLDSTKSREITEMKGPELNAKTKEAGGAEAKKEAGGAEGASGADGSEGTGNADGIESTSNSNGIGGRSTQEWMALAKNDPKAFGEAMAALYKEDGGKELAEKVMRDMQELTQFQNQISTMLTNLMMTDHQTKKSIIQNFRV